MLTQVDVSGARALAPLLPLDDTGSAQTDPLQILGITGLEPVKATISTQSLSVFDGEILTGTNVGKRNIVLTIGLNPDWNVHTIEELRTQLYAYFMPKSFTRLVFTSTHLPKCQIDGYVESMDPNLFSKDPQIDVSIICPSPDFVASDPSVVLGPTVTDPTSLHTIDYNGSVPCGFHLKLTKVGVDLGENSIQVINNTEFANTVFESLGIVSDLNYYEMNSVPGRKYSRSVRTDTGVIINYLRSVFAPIGWPTLMPGQNKVAIVTPISHQNYEIQYFERYGGL